MPIAAALERGEEGLGHPHDAEHVRLVHLTPVLLVRLSDGLQPKGAPGVVDHDRDVGQRLGEMRDGLRIGDIELKRPAAHLASHLLAALLAPVTSATLLLSLIAQTLSRT